MKTAVLIILRLTSALVGFVAAVSFMRTQNGAYDFYIGRLFGNLSNWFNFGMESSLLLLASCLIFFTVTICQKRGSVVYPLRRVDYSFLLVFCCVGFVVCTRMVWTAFAPWGLPTGLFTYVIALPFVAYCLALLAFGELVARLRDRVLIKTLYWVGFFKVYSAWQPVGFLALLLLFSQVIVMAVFHNLLIVMGVSVFVLGVFTYYAVHMINLAAEYDIAAADKIRSERFKSELITNVSHDIKTPLTSIINYVNLLSNEGLEGQSAGYVDVLAKKSSRLKVLIDDLMEASKASTGNLSVELQVINLVEMVGQVAGEFEDVFAENGLTLVIRQPNVTQDYTSPRHKVYAEAEDRPNAEGHSGQEGPPVSLCINADSRHLYRALENLFSNVAKYSLEGTRVFAEIFPLLREGKVQFALQNTSAAPIEVSGRELTEQFIRGDMARQTEGSGLGLYIAKSLVELMGGRLDIRVIGDLFRVEVVMDAKVG